MADYRTVADAVAADIAAGRLRPGDRLPTQRAFARRHGIANSTASRVYRELAARGLVVGEVGRGTFVRAARRPPGPALAEPAGARVDLELSNPSVPGQSELMRAGMERLLRPDVLGAALGPAGAAGTPAAREAAAGLLAAPGWRPDPSRVLFAGNGRQAIAGAVAALVPPGGRLAAEAVTYPVIKGIAARLGVTLVPVETDEHGLCPDALASAHRSAPLGAVYLQPTLHNPYGTTMPRERRAELAAVLERLGLHAIEDRVWAFLPEDGPPPLAAEAPHRTVVVDSLSKRLAPGLSVGFAVPPAELTGRVAAALRSGAWGPAAFALDAATGWITDGTVAAVTRAKRADAAARMRIAAERLPGAAGRSAPRAYFCWWDLPPRWRAETFVAAAARRGIAVTPAAAFAAGTGSSPRAVRVGLASPPLQLLGDALGVLAEIAAGSPEDSPVD
ncbi:aminotransferase-like domain-containing protein [Actinomadura livida]|uniref:DNA-binding transcriptional MocR family regulator n=1 Tax=Actinomadura livida TaxID=79909 RepID=A0A7W7MYT6_9ACTN|nr:MULTISPECIES: PLP-dependent aminotransferase family protein [Actinomadura]MBB4775192.1 DNA-binding transcriptional MocR family regulator [Actinomadura catellatispora]GGT88509.1 GntR family transcriptional regulator [Actinomadura livida]